MKLPAQTLFVLFGVLSQSLAFGQAFTSGSTGAYGVMNITENTTLPLPVDGVFHCTTIAVAEGATLKFTRNIKNTPVYLLAMSDVQISGTIDVTGSPPAAPFAGGVGGPGGFNGGTGGFTSANSVQRGGAGLGPGGGKSGGSSPSGGAGGGAFGAGAPSYQDANDGQVYGSQYLLPLVGGSGGGGIDGNPALGGGGGGGALLIASSTKITLATTGKLISNGGLGGGTVNLAFNGGSGGGIRLAAPRVYGTGTIDVSGAYATSYGGTAGPGRIRIDSIYTFEPTNPAAENLSIKFQPANITTVGSSLTVFPPRLPRLNIIEAAGRTIPLDSLPVFVELPFGADTNRTVTVRAENFGAKVPIRVALIPNSGDVITYDSEIDNAAVDFGQVAVPVGFPINTVVNVQVWSR